MTTIETFPGNHIREVLAQAVAAAIQSGEPAHFSFNAIEFVAQPTDSYDSAKSRWAEQTGMEVLTAEEEAEQARTYLDKMTAEQEAAITAAKVPTEKELRESAAAWPKSPEELQAYIKTLVDRPHDYGTCVYAMSLAAVAALNYVASALGVTGFQASCADLDIIRRTRHLEVFSIRNYEDLLYPQYADKFSSTVSADTWKWLQERARALLAESRGHAAPRVVAHWQAIADDQPPFGFTITEA